MKRLSVGVMAVVVAFLVGTVAYGVQQGYGPGNGQPVDVNAFRQFQKETLPLRDELLAKGLELRNEYIKENPDQAKVTKLRDEISALRAKIQSAAEKQGISDGRFDPGMMYGYGGGQGYGMRGRDRGWMMDGGYGRGPGYGRGYCPMW